MPVPSPEALLRQADFVRCLARSLLADASDADDVSQDALVRALETPPRHGDRLRSWLASVVHNGVRQHLRGATRRKSRERSEIGRAHV